MNLLTETRENIEQSGHTPSQIIFIGSERSGHSCTFKEYEKLADIEYHDGYGAQEVATDLIIVFSDGSKMWRGEYDGSEGWEYSTPFKTPLERNEIRTLAKGIWATLKELNP